MSGFDPRFEAVISGAISWDVHSRILKVGCQAISLSNIL